VSICQFIAIGESGDRPCNIIKHEALSLEAWGYTNKAHLRGLISAIATNVKAVVRTISAIATNIKAVVTNIQLLEVV
jgi:hypothetical protein